MGSATTGKGGALERLRLIAAGVPARDFASRLTAVFEEAGRAIEALGILELGKYTDLSETGVPDLSVWEELAPVIRNTLMDVNRLLAVVRERFPEPPVTEDAFEDGEGLLRQRAAEAKHQIQVLANSLAAEITNLGERMRSPQIVSDRWNLIADLQEFRGKFRQTIGDMVFLSASAFAQVSREEVIPGYAEEIAEAVEARRAVTDVARLLSVYGTRFGQVKPEELKGLLDSLQGDLDAFGRSRPFVLLRTSDKRQVIEFRALLSKLASAPNVAQVSQAVRSFAQFTQGLSHINRRACLVEHDREVLASCGVKLENAAMARPERPSEAAQLLAEAVKAAQEVYGRNPALDAYLRKARKRDLAALQGPALDFEMEFFRGLVASAMAM